MSLAGEPIEMHRRRFSCLLLVLAALLIGGQLNCSQDGGGHGRPVARLAKAQAKGVVRDVRKKNKLALQQRRQRAVQPAKTTPN
jgi:hypothetical protein